MTKDKTRPAKGTLPSFLPVPRQTSRHDGWTPERQRRFIEALADTGSVEAAARAVNMSSVGAYLLRRHPEAKSFRKAWEAALALGVQRIEDVAMERALNGVEVPVYAYGKIIGTRRVYNDRLLMFMLRNRAPKRFAADGAKGMNAVDRQLLKRLKKQWRKEWEEERLAEEQRSDSDVLESLNAKLELMRRRQLEAEAMLGEDIGEPEKAVNLPPWPEPEGEEEEPEDDGPQVRTLKDEKWR